jgi:hypothetical protein
MRFVRTGADYAARFTIFLLVVLGTSGCNWRRSSEQVRSGNAISIPCEDKQTIDVNLTNGATPDAVYVCEDQTVIWQDNGHKFEVQFKDDSPFKGDAKKFDNKSPTSKGGKNHAHITVFKYTITVYDDKGNPHPFDPHVIGGGGYPFQLIVESTVNTKRD